MRTRLRTIAPWLIAASALTLVAGCAASPAEPDPDATDDSSASSASAEATVSAGDAATACLASGPWQLDTAAYSTDVEAFLTETGLTVNDIQIDGGQTLEFTAEGAVSLTTDLAFENMIAMSGQEMVVTSHRTDAGSGSWDWADESASTFTFSDWTWTKEETVGTATVNGVELPADQQPGIPPFDPADAGVITATCSDGALRLQGASPLSANWTQ